MKINSKYYIRGLFICICILTLFLFANFSFAQPSSNQPGPRIIITADPELDDNNSLIRLLLYSNELNIEGLVYASSQFHWKGDGKGTRWYVPGREYDRFGLKLCPCESWRWRNDERFIHDIVEAYAKVYPNLKRHDQNYPDPQDLISKIRYGNIDFDGDYSKDSPGSDLIKSLMLDEKPGKLFITAWGGHSTIARALKSIQDQYEFTLAWEAVKKKISRKIILLPSGDQDDTYANYIKPNWPDIEYRQFTAGPNYGYGAQLNAKPEDSVFLTPSWMKKNVSERGALGSLYRVWGDGKQMVKNDIMDYFGMANYSTETLKKMGYVVWMPVQPKGSWLGEGDNHTFMNMLGNGLRAYEFDFYGGWGGHGPVSQAQKDLPYPNFFPQAQRDFAARLKWSVSPAFSNANHKPIVNIEGPLHVLTTANQKIRLNGNATDPDGNKVSFRWWQFMVGTYPGKIMITNSGSAQAEITIPKDAGAGQTIHLILEATDNGTPQLTSYQRLIITVGDKPNWPL